MDPTRTPSSYLKNLYSQMQVHHSLSCTRGEFHHHVRLCFGVGQVEVFIDQAPCVSGTTNTVWIYWNLLTCQRCSADL